MRFSTEWIGRVIIDFDGDLAVIRDVENRGDFDRMSIQLLECRCPARNHVGLMDTSMFYYIQSNRDEAANWTFAEVTIEEEFCVDDLWEAS